MSSQTMTMPLTSLSISNVNMHEQGFKYMMAQFGKLHQKSVQMHREFEQSMHLDISRNILSDESLKVLAELVRQFEGFRSLNLMSIRPNISKKEKDAGYYDLAKAIRENKSLVELDLRDNQIPELPLQKLLEALDHNYVLSELKIDTKQRKMPEAFASYALQSMYDFTASIEDITLLTTMLSDDDEE